MKFLLIGLSDHYSCWNDVFINFSLLNDLSREATVIGIVRKTLRDTVRFGKPNQGSPVGGYLIACMQSLFMTP